MDLLEVAIQSTCDWDLKKEFQTKCSSFIDAYSVAICTMNTSNTTITVSGTSTRFK